MVTRRLGVRGERVSWRPTVQLANGGVGDHAAVLADYYGRDRILLAGDAVHTMIPTGGYGMTPPDSATRSTWGGNSPRPFRVGAGHSC
jgi:FAD binding domain